MSKSSSKPPSAEMRAAVDEAIKEFEKLISDPASIGACPELPGIVLDRIVGQPLDRTSEEYDQTTKAYVKMRGEYLKALALHPVGRSLSLLAVGPDGVRLMESGHSPSSVINAAQAINQPVRFRRQHYNCHHIIPKSVAVAGGRAAINHPRNFVIANTTRRGRDQSQNPHHFWHALFLHPQTHRSVDQSNPDLRPAAGFPPLPTDKARIQKRGGFAQAPSRAGCDSPARNLGRPNPRILKGRRPQTVLGSKAVS